MDRRRSLRSFRMALIVVDSNILVDHLRAKQPVIEALADGRRRGDRLAGSVVTRVEILSGMRAHEKRATHALLDLVD